MAIRISGVNIIDDGFNILNLSKISAGGTYGTSGQVLTSGGPSANVSWAASASTGRLLRAPQVLTSGTSYTTPAGCTGIYAEAVGGGGGGAGASNGNVGGGGGAAGYAAKYFTVTASTAYTYAIGAAGTAGAAGTSNAGGNGGNTTFTVGATTITAAGGRGASFDSEPGWGGVAINGDINVRGGGGGGGIDATNWNFGGFGGNSFFGGGARMVRYNGAGQAGDRGGGGGGAVENNAGGAGGAGVIRIWEFA